MPVARTLFTTLLAVAAAVSWSPVPDQAESAPAPGSRSRFLGTVTLVTGDQVAVRQVGEQFVPQVTPAPGREHVHFTTTAVGDSLLVLPNDAWTPVRTGRLDQRLFDVTALLRDGYGDSDRPDLPLIVQGGPPDASASGATVTRDLSAVDATAVRQPKESAAGFWTAARQETGRIWLDGMRHPSLDVSVPQIGAPAAWDAGYTGKGVRVAVLDTGIDQTHPDLRRRVAAAENFTDDLNVRDLHGHGTHVASTIAGTGAASGGRNTGVAPDADLLIGKVCGGVGCSESAILAGMQWAVESDAKVVNLSLGGPNTAGEDPLELAVERMSAEHGTLFVIAAGNDGANGAETVASPGSANAALTVGAVDDQDAIARFSGRGPRVGDAALKPDVVAPGVDISAARSRFSQRGEPRDRYTTMSGTSMATPHVAGAAAVLAQRHPDWSGARLKAALIASAKPLADTAVFAQGAGRVDVARSVEQTVSAEPATVSIGRMSWPHEDDRTVTRTVAYHNDGDRERTLRLTLPVRGPGGEPVPEGMFALSATTLTVPAHGRASVDVTVDTAMPATEGTFGAHIVATDETGVQVSTPVAVDREPESYDLTVRPLDANGEPTDNHYTVVFGVDQPRFRPVPGIDGSGTLRVRAGRYHVDSAITTRDGTLSDTDKVVHPTVDVRADTTVVLDARTARPISVSFERDDLVSKAVAVTYSRKSPHALLNSGLLGARFDRMGIGEVGEPAPEEELITSIGGVWAVPDEQGEVLESPVTYNLSWFEYGSVPTGFSREVVDDELAQVRVTYRTQANGKLGTKIWIAREPRFGEANGFGFGFRLPLERTEYHNVDGLLWSGELQQWSRVRQEVRTETILGGSVVDHEAGKSTEEDWNSAVFGPGYTGDGQFATRSGDTLSVNLPMFADGGADRAGVSLVESGKTVLYQDDVKLGESAEPGVGSFDVPAEQAEYRLEAEARRGADVSRLSTVVSCVWTFTSARPPDPDPEEKDKGGAVLPLLTVRFAPPDLNLRNVVTARRVRIPVTVDWPAGSPEATLDTLTVDASFDDGRTWQPLTVSRDRPDGGTVAITHSQVGPFVSLRATASDSAGNTVTQTIVRAYQRR